MEKTCKQCGKVLDVEMFYKNASMSDGRLNTCKKCITQNVKKNRSERADYYKEYDRNRKNAKERVEMCKARKARLKKDSPEKYKRQIADASKRYKEKYRDKASARDKLYSAVISGKIKAPDECVRCGREGYVEAHHTDYSKPLDVLWLCDTCHKQAHKEQRRIQRLCAPKS